MGYFVATVVHSTLRRILMATIQTQFEAFDDAIRLGKFKENATLSEKRDIIRRKLETNLPLVFANYNETCPKFEFYDQGSYAMGTGTKPLDGDYDIDQGLYFLIRTNDYPDPVVLKERVHEALDGHTNHVELRRSCVTVFYSENDEPLYHVDVAVYADGSQQPDGKSRLAKGKRHSDKKNRLWELSSPRKLQEQLFARFTLERERVQLRRIVRYWKRWKAVNFHVGGGAAPNGISLTILTSNDLQPTFTDVFANKANDLVAMRMVVEAVLGQFVDVYDSEQQQWMRRITVKLPVEPWTDVLERMTNLQMAEFEEKLKTLRDALAYAEGISDPTAACERLRIVFGDDFPVPPKTETARTHPPAITSSGNSA
jgi:hypothetical protein